MKGNLWHPGITMHKIRVGGDAGGLLCVIASAAAVLVGVPTMGYFFALAIAGGITVAAMLHGLHGAVLAGHRRHAEDDEAQDRRRRCHFVCSAQFVRKVEDQVT